MYDMTKFSSANWEMKFVDGTVLHILPPKLINRYKLVAIIEDINDENYSETLLECTLLILNNNKENIVYDKEKIKSLLSEDNMIDLISHFTDWLNEEADSKN